jgi:hypothetical protein
MNDGEFRQLIKSQIFVSAMIMHLVSESDQIYRTVIRRKIIVGSQTHSCKHHLLDDR